MSTTTATDLECLIRSRIADAGLSINRLARESGVARSTIRRFVEGGGIRVGTLCKVAEVVGLRIVHQSIKGESACQFQS